MATAAEGIISVLYRPLDTMDKLHVLLLAAVSVQTTELFLLEKIFSLPGNVVIKELASLEIYGLVQKMGNKWKATSRGQRLYSVWNAFQNRSEAEVRTSERQWLLGPGKFAVEEMCRDKGEIEEAARNLGVADVGSAAKFLEERRMAAKEFDTFLVAWSSRAPGDTTHGVFGEAIVFENVRLAETEEALTRLRELLATKIGELVNRSNNSCGDHVDGNQKSNDITLSIRKDGQDVMKNFNDAMKNQRRQNQKIAKVKATCEALLVSQWLSASLRSIAEAFNEEPAGFVFTSTVPLMQPEVINRAATSAPILSPTTKPKQKEEGVLRSLFRWLFG
jgi:hypothetical protein